MSRLFPHPLLFVALLVMWLILTSFSLGHLLLGSVIACGAAWVLGLLRPKRVLIYSWPALIRLFFIVAYDILKSNIAVSRQILMGPASPTRNPGFIHIDLALRDRNGLAALAIIITATPGTAWIEYNPENGGLLLHILDLNDEDDWHKLIRERYEKLLREIFE